MCKMSEWSKCNIWQFLHYSQTSVLLWRNTFCKQLEEKKIITVQDFRGSYCSGWEAEKIFFLCLLLSHLEHQPIRYHIQVEFSISQSFLWDISIGTPRDVLSYLGSSHSINLTRLTFSSSECIYPCVQICTVFVNLIYAPVLIQYQRSW